jgi:hypothetical protein
MRPSRGLGLRHCPKPQAAGERDTACLSAVRATPRYLLAWDWEASPDLRDSTSA